MAAAAVEVVAAAEVRVVQRRRGCLDPSGPVRAARHLGWPTLPRRRHAPAGEVQIPADVAAAAAAAAGAVVLPLDVFYSSKHVQRLFLSPFVYVGVPTLQPTTKLPSIASSCRPWHFDASSSLRRSGRRNGADCKAQKMPPAQERGWMGLQKRL